MKKTPSILVASPKDVFRLGLLSLIESCQLASHVWQTDSFEATLELNTSYQPSLILLDATLRDGQCIDKIYLLLQARPAVKILLLLMPQEFHSSLTALRMGVYGIIDRDNSAQQFALAIESVSAGKLWLEPAIAEQLMQRTSLLPEDEQREKLNCLTPREQDIVCLAAQGLTAKLIAQQLSSSEKTVRNQLTEIYRKLDVKNQVALCLAYGQFDFCSHCEPNKQNQCGIFNDKK